MNEHTSVTTDGLVANFSQAHVDPLASIGINCTIGIGAIVEKGCQIGSDVEIGHHAVLLGNGKGSTAVHVGNRVKIGANATVHSGITLASGCIVCPGAVVTRNVPPGAIVEGNPASIIGYVNAASNTPLKSGREQRGPSEISTEVRGVTLHNFPIISDLRGSLTVGEFPNQIPFLPQRYFMVFGVPSREIRGEHAHHACHQFLVCVRGSCAVVADDGTNRAEFSLDAPNIGLYLPPKTWGIQYKYSPDALLLVFASHHYDAADYIRDYDEFIQQTKINEN